jgi:hypothetical protein
MTMRVTKRLAMSAAVLGMMAGSAMAADIDPVTESLITAAILEISVGAHDARETDGSMDLNEGTELTFAGQGAVSFPLGDTVSVQLDGQSEFYDRGKDLDDPLSAHMFGAHLSLRDPGTGLVGLFAGGGISTNGESGNGSEGIGYLAGLEGQFYIDNFTLYGQAGYANFAVDDASPDDEGFTDGWFASAEARYFIHEDFMLSANLAYGATGSYADGDDNGEIWNWGAGAKLRLADSMPLYGTLTYRGGTYTETEDDIQGTEHAVLVGVSMAFGASNLQENDRRGATLATPMLPVRAAAWTEAID